MFNKVQLEKMSSSKGPELHSNVYLALWVSPVRIEAAEQFFQRLHIVNKWLSNQIKKERKSPIELDE